MLAQGSEVQSQRVSKKLTRTVALQWAQSAQETKWFVLSGSHCSHCSHCKIKSDIREWLIKSTIELSWKAKIHCLLKHWDRYLNLILHYVLAMHPSVFFRFVYLHSRRWESSILCGTYNTSNCLIYIYCKQKSSHAQFRNLKIMGKNSSGHLEALSTWKSRCWTTSTRQDSTSSLVSS